MARRTLHAYTITPREKHCVGSCSLKVRPYTYIFGALHCIGSVLISFFTNFSPLPSCENILKVLQCCAYKKRRWQNVPDRSVLEQKVTDVRYTWKFPQVLSVGTIVSFFTSNKPLWIILYRSIHCYKGKIIAIYGLGICSLWYRSFPALFQNPEFSGNLHGHWSGESFACVGILHSSMTEDISVIFWRFPCEKMKECVPGGIKLMWVMSLGVLSLASAPTTVTL